MTREEMKLFESSTPEEYITNSLKVKLPSGRKAFITRLWLEENPQFSIEDIQHARNRHPHWKEKKMEGSQIRNRKRQEQHDYSDGAPSIDWDSDTITDFINLNKKNKNGRYLYRDYELAKHFKSTIPSIQHYRRKHNMALKILDKEGVRPTVARIQKLIIHSEQWLRGELKKK